MLGKLLKHEFRATARTMLPMFGVVLVLSLLANLSFARIADIERVLDEVVFLKDGKVTLQSPVEAIREEQGRSVDSLFREVFKC